MNSGTTDNLRGVWGTSGDHVIATSQLGAILVFDGSDWAPTPAFTTDPIGPVSGLDEDFVVAAGGGPPGSFLHFSGANWTVRSTGGSQKIADVAGIPGASVRAALLVGDGGVAFAALEDTVLAITTGTNANLTSAFATGAEDMVIVGDGGTVLVLDFSSVGDVRPVPGLFADLTGFTRRGYNDGFLCAADGSVFGFDRCSTRPSKSSGAGLFDMAQVSNSQIMAVGAEGTIFSYSSPAPASCPDAVTITVSGGTTPTISWSPECPVYLVLVEEGAGDMWLVAGDGNVIEPGVRYGDHHPCEVDFWLDAPLLAGVEYDVILFRSDGPGDFTLIGMKTFVP
jgi:hypothetical protein